MNNYPHLEILPLGGLGEIGQNMTLIKTQEEWIIIDAGILFPFDQNFGIQYLTVPFGEIVFPEKTSLIITHGHEDHVGAIPHLLKFHPHIKIFCSSFAKRIIDNKLKNFNMHKSVQIYDEETIITTSELDIYPIRVNHSIAETFGLLFQNKKQTFSLFFASDFKYDDSSPYEKVMDLARLKKLTKKSDIKLLMLDSTNILDKEKTPSESELIRPIESILKKRKKRTFITFFPSNVHRLQTIISVAKKLKRKIVYFGRSLEFYLHIAQEENLLNHFKETYFPLEKVTKENQDNLLILLTGCQGDFKGTLSRVIQGHHPLFILEPGDLILFSSKVIPGNEKNISRLLNQASMMGAEIITARDALVHTSGHASKKDLQKVIEAFRPTHYVPIHGETYFLSKHIQFVQTISPDTKCFFLTNFTGLALNSSGTFEPFHEEQKEPDIYLDQGILIEKEQLRERKRVALNGLVIVTLFKTGVRELFLNVEFLGLPLILEQLKEKMKALLINEIHKDFTLEDIDENEKLKTLVRHFLKPHFSGKPVVSIIRPSN